MGVLQERSRVCSKKTSCAPFRRHPRASRRTMAEGEAQDMQNSGELVRAARKRCRTTCRYPKTCSSGLPVPCRPGFSSSCVRCCSTDMPDEQAITQARALCLQAQLFSGSTAFSRPAQKPAWNELANLSARPLSTDNCRKLRYTERTAYPMRAHFISRTACAVNPNHAPRPNTGRGTFQKQLRCFEKRLQGLQ